MIQPADPSLPAPSGNGAFWDQRYRERSWPIDPDPLVARTVGALPEGTAVDLGCGTGRHAIWLAHHGWTVTGVDASAVGLAMAAERAAAERVQLKLIQTDILGFTPPPPGFDLVLLANIHPAGQELRAVLDRAAKALAPDGHLLIVGHHLDSLGRSGPPDGRRLYTVERVREALPTELLIERLERVESQVAGVAQAPDVAVIALLRRPSS